MLRTPPAVLVPVLVPVLLTAVLAGLVAPPVGALAPQPTAVSRQDPAGDLAQTAAGDTVLRPSVDVRRVGFRAAEQPRALVGRVRFEDLRTLVHPGGRRYRQYLSVLVSGVAPSDIAYVITRTPSAEGPSATLVAGDAAADCKGDTVTVDLAADTIGFRLPVRCLARAADGADVDQVRLRVWSRGVRAYADGEDPVGLDVTRRTAVLSLP